MLDFRPLTAVVLWGGIYPAAKLALRDLPLLSFTWLRIVLASAFLLAAAGRGLGRALDPAQRRPLVGAGLAQTAFQLLLVAGVAFTTAGETAILVATAPLMTAIWQALVRGERLARRQWAGLLVGLLGVAFVVQPNPTTPAIVGGLLALGAAAAWAWYSLAVGSLVAAFGSLRATAATMLVAAVLTTPIALPQVAHLRWDAVGGAAWAGLAYGAIFGMAVAMALWGTSVHRLGPTRTMIYAYLEPASAVVISAVLLGESLTLVQAAGALTVFLGVGLAS